MSGNMTAVQELEKRLGSQVLVFNTDFRALRIEDWMDACSRIVTNDARLLIARDDGSVIRSQYLVIKRPLVIVLNRWVPIKDRKKMSLDSHASMRSIRQRDNFTCAYCGKKGYTVDHIQPKSRGGQNTWGNLVTACQKCNTMKANRTPQEAGMKVPVVKESEIVRLIDKIQQLAFDALGEIS